MVGNKRLKKKSRESWGAIRELPSGRYQASYLHAGNRFTAPKTFDAVQDARGWLAGVRVDIQRNAWRDPRSKNFETFGDYAQAWLEQRLSSKGEPLRPRTRVEYRRQLNGGLKLFAPSRLEEISPARVRAWHLSRMNASGATSAARETALLRAILSTAVIDGIVARNPVDSKLSRSTSRLSHRPPTLQELAILVEEMGASAPRLKLAVLLAAYGGLRISEWRALRRRDLGIEGDRATVFITRQAQRIAGEGWVVGPTKTTEGVRAVPLPSSLTEEVHKHLSAHVGPFAESLLFEPAGRSDFLHDSQFNVHWNRAREIAGVRVKDGDKWVSVVREHDLRHFHLSFYAVSGATLAELKARAGHSTTQAAMVYQHAVVDRGAELADAMPALPVVSPRMARIEQR